MYFSLLARIPEFLVGGLLAISFKNGININKHTTNFLAIISIIVIIVCTIFITEQTPFPGIIALIPCTAAALLLSLKSNWVSNFFSTKPMVYIGELSYSLYLWHFPIMALVRYRNDDNNLSLLQMCFITFLTAILAAASYYLIEKKSKKITDKKSLVLITGVAAVLLTYSYYLPKIFSHKEIHANYSKRQFGKESHNSLTIQKFGDLTKKSSIFLFGDSHAWSLKSFFDIIGKEHNFSFTTITCDSYPALKGILKEEAIAENGLVYWGKAQEQINITDSMIKKNETIILAVIGVERPNSQYLAIEDLCKKLKQEQKLIIINSYPTLLKNPLKINSSYIKNNNLVIEREDNKLTTSKLLAIAKKYSNVYIYNLDESRINKQLGYINDTVSFYDKRHINLHGAQKLAEIHSKEFSKLLKDK